MKKFLYLGMAVILLVSILLTGCSEKTSTATQTVTSTATATATSTVSQTTTTSMTTTITTGPMPDKGGILKQGTMLAGRSGDWAFPATQMSDRWYNICFEPLIREYLDGTMEPMLATDWEFNSDYSSLTLTIRQGVKFHDGSDLNAEVVKWNLDMQKEYDKPITKFFSSIEVVDDYTVQIGITEYQNTILSNLANLVGLMYSKEAFDKNGLEWCKTHPVGTGPFVFDSMEADVKTTWVKFDGYWQEGKPYLDGYEQYSIPELMTLQAAMLKGDVKVMLPRGGGSLAIRELQDKGFNIIYTPADPVCLWPDSVNADSPFYETAVRQAVSYAIDRDAVSALMGGYQVPAYQLPSPAYAAYDSTYEGTQYNVDKAKELLASAGMSDGFQTSLTTPFIPQDIMVAMQGYLSKVGIEAELSTINMGQMVDYQTKGWNNGLFAIPCTPYPNWAFGLQMQLSTSAVNLKSVARPESIDSLLAQALSTPEEDVTITRQVLRLLQEPCLTIPIFYAGSLYACSPDVRDTGYLEIANSVYWTPENAWIAK